MKVVLHGILKEMFVECEIIADTVADVIEGWSRQCGLADIPLTQRPTITVVDFEEAESLFQKTDVTEIHLIPAMFGGGGSFGQILIGAALIGASFLTGGTVAAALMAAGIGMVIGGVMSMFMKAPSVSASDDPDPSKYLGTKGNTTAIGTLIPKGFGRFPVSGQYMSLQVNSQDMVFGSFPATA